MIEDPSIPKSAESLEDGNLASFNEQYTGGSSQVFGWLAIVVFGVIAVIYLGKYGGGFDSGEYLESASIAEEIASLGGGTGGSEEGSVVAVDPVKAGEKIYQTTCMACHQVTGMGLPGAFPPLVESDWVAKDPQFLARIVLSGLQGPITVNGTEYNSIMAPLGAALSDDQIAHALTYIRQAFGNSADAVDPAVVTEARAESGNRGMWTIEELGPWLGQ